uniref:DNA-binding protein SATB n=1 Tax=Astyanax mexicanus TaxID=7994 RepID=A0A3B1J5S0_ASTMX
MSLSDVELEQMMAKRDGEIVRLREEVQRLQLTLQEAQQSTASHISRLQQQLANKMENIERLKAKLHSQQDYEKIKEELRVLKERRQASAAHFHLVSVSSPASDRAGLEIEGEEVPGYSADLCISGAEIKREVETPPTSHPSTELVRDLSNPVHTSSDHSESSRRSTPSPCPNTPSPHDLLPCLSIKSENSNTAEDCASPRADSCWTRDISNNWSSAGNALGTGMFLEGVENQITTAEIAQQVKELLQKHKIGQRVFGQFVLDRLQGSVSEILAHPKPWSKLTTRGKEPFLRMIHFLSDEQNVLVLQIIQDRLRGEQDSSLKTFGNSSSVIHSSDKHSDDAIRNILENAKKEQQSQSEGDESRVHHNQSRHDATHEDLSMGRGSEDMVRGILMQVRREIEVQKDAVDQQRRPAVDPLMSSDFQVKQEQYEKSSLSQQSPVCELLSLASPSDFVQNIIRKVKSEIGAEGFSSSCTNQSTFIPASPILHLPILDTSHKPSPGRGGGTGDGNLEISESPEMDQTGLDQLVHLDHTPLESYKENLQPPQALDGRHCVKDLSQPDADLHNGLDAKQQMLQRLELDTLSITRKVKEVLVEHNLGQRLLGEQVLGLSQGSVSDLLARPKPWKDLSVKGREPFIRMYLWLKDPQNIESLKTMKTLGQRAQTKRPFSLLSAWSDSTSQEPLLDVTAHPPEQFTMAKRPRVVLTSREKEVLSKAFQLEPYPSHHTTQRLALQLGLQASTVTNWFYNHRSRLRRTIQDERSAPTEYSNSSFLDPLFWPCHNPNSNSSSTTQHTSMMDTGLVTIKSEPSDAEISEVRVEDTDLYWDTKYVSTGVQSCKNLKLEEEQDQRIQSSQSEDGIEDTVKKDLHLTQTLINESPFT